VVLDLVLPRRCLSCARLGADLCEGCRAALPLLLGTHCARCGAPTLWPVSRCRECAGRRVAFASARAAVAYEGAVPALVAAWKERGLRRFAELAADVVCDAVACPSADAVVFVPADGDRSLRRGHHPAERLARELGERWHLTTLEALARSRTPRRQRGLTIAERRRNVAGAFVASRRVPRRLVLVDDVYTTGSTLDACATALRAAGSGPVTAVCFARTLRARAALAHG
jgi:ComF family protein